MKWNEIFQEVSLWEFEFFLLSVGIVECEMRLRAVWCCVWAISPSLLQSTRI